MDCTLCNNKVCLDNIVCEEISIYNTTDTNLYKDDPEVQNIYRLTSEIPKNIPRIEEVKIFIEKMNFKKIGVAFCKGLQKEARDIVAFLNFNNEVEFYSILCANEDINKKNGNLGSPSLNITCNPIGQCTILNKLETDLNIAIGLCVGHDIIFSKYSKAPITTLVVKDRVYKHKPLDYLTL